MPRTPTTQVLYLELAAEELEVKAAKEILGVLKAVKQPWEKIPYEVAQPLEPLAFRLVIPKIKIKEAAASCTFFLEDVTGAAQIIGEWVVRGGTNLATSCPVMERIFIPAKDATIEPEASGERKFSISAETSGETATINANTAKCKAYIQILGLGR